MTASPEKDIWRDVQKLMFQSGFDCLEKLAIQQWGERCDDFHPECYTCQTWQRIDDLRKRLDPEFAELLFLEDYQDNGGKEAG